MKSHHIATDGLGIAILLQAISDENDVNNLTGRISQSLLFEVFVYLLSPILIVWAILDILSDLRQDRNCVKNSRPLTGKKVLAFTRDISIDRMKCKSKQLGITINDLITAILSMSISQYMQNHRDDNEFAKVVPESIQVTIPFTTRSATNRP